jgi:hypothetical protein
MEIPMLSRPGKQSIISCSHSVLHRIPLYNEKPKESSINIKKMTRREKTAGFVFHFKKKFYFENLNPCTGGIQWAA